jgi:hypothetical protein
VAETTITKTDNASQASASGNITQTTTVVTTVKPAYLTTEFYGHVIISVIGLLVAAGLVKSDNAIAQAIIQIAGLLVAGGSQAAYAMSRGNAKGGSK